MNSRQRCLRLWKPEGHAHGPQERQGGGQFGAGLLPLSYPAIQDTKAEVTVGHERAHTKLVSQGEGLLIVGYGLSALQGIAPRRNLAEEVQGICFVAPFLMRTGKRQRMLSQGVRLFQAAS